LIALYEKDIGMPIQLVFTARRRLLFK
jgi:hypothetical protein